MLNTDPNREYEDLKRKLLAEVQSTFPIADPRSGYEVRVKNLVVADSKLGTDDIKGQLQARLSGRSYTAPIEGDVEVVDRNGKVLVAKRMKIADIPKLTRHYTFIHGGQERSVTNQWRLRPGPYVKKTEREGEFEAQFQLAKGRPFDIQMDPVSSYLFVKAGRKIPLYSVLKATGISDEEMKKQWGEKAFEATKAKSNYEKDLHSFYTSMKHGGTIPEGTPPAMAVVSYLATTKMDPAVTKTTLGAPFEQVTGDALLRASHKLIEVSGGRTRPDPIDSLEFKELWTPTDHFVERLRASKLDIHGRVLKSLSKDKTQAALVAGQSGILRDIVMPDLIQKPINHVFVTSLATAPKQTNPVAMLADRTQTTIMGPGGIKSEHQVTLSNTSVDPSQLGFVDPVFTPEGSPGTVTHLTSSVTIRDRKPMMRVFNLKTHKIEELTPAEASRTVLVLPDQVKWSGGHPKPLADLVRVKNEHGEIEEKPISHAHYAMISPTQVFSTETNLVPFMQNDAAGRTTMSARHMAQAISLTGREAPHVQVQAVPGTSFEKRIGETFIAHKSPVNGTIAKVEPGEIVVKGSDGAEHSVHLYDHFPMNEKKSMLHSTPLVKVGDKVSTGQILADHSFSKNGVLALGTNVLVAYLANGSNHEDGIVISESAQKKMSTSHLLKPSLYVTSDHEVSSERFQNEKRGTYRADQLKNIGEDGVIKVGTKVRPGDPLILALKADKNPDTIDAKMLSRLSRQGRLSYGDASVVWDHEHEGEVVRVVKADKNLTVHVKTVEPMVVGSKVSTRHSAKGIVTQILPDAEMPQFTTKDGKKQHVEMLINPVSVPGRMNPGQILETAAGKIAEKTGKPYIVKNFDGGTDYLKQVQNDLHVHGLKETELLTDPKTGRELGEVTVGPHYVFQLEHQIDKKTHVRHGGAYLKAAGIPHIQYDTNMVPRGGGESGAQSLGSLGIYGALAAGLTKNLGEMQTYKSDQSQAEGLWGHLASGALLAPPQIPFVYRRFGAMLQGAGLNLEKKGNIIRLIPQTDADTLKLANGARGKVTDPSLTVAAKNMKPKGGGIFDPNIFGVDKTGWGYIELAYPMPNPVFSKAIAAVLHLEDRKSPHKEIAAILSGEKKLKGKSGGDAIRDALASINIDKEMAAFKKKIDDPKVKDSDLNEAVYGYKSLQALKAAGKTPAEAYTMKYVPVLPPIYRPYQEGVDQVDKIDPLNQLYRRLGQVNKTLDNQRKEGIPERRLLKAQGDLFREVQFLFGTTPKGKKALDIDFKGREIKSRSLPGILHTIAGDSPKDGFFQDRVIGKKQDYTARATIVADPTLGADEIGVPKKIAFELFRPMVGRRLTQQGWDPIQAQKEISARSPAAEQALQQEVAARPVLMKRDPVLHQYGIIAQNVKLTDSRAIKVSPLVLPPLGGDIDGDTAALMLPISHAAVQEAYKLLPSNRPLSASTGGVLFTPTNESMLALYRMGLKKRDTNHSFPSQSEAEVAFKSNKINLDDGIEIGGVKTTLGRARIAAVVPEKYKSTILHDVGTPVSKKFVTDMLHDTAKHEPAMFDSFARNITQLGFKMAYESGHTVSLADLEPLRRERAKVIAEATQQVQGKSDEERTKIWVDATKKLHEIYAEHHKTHPTNVSDMRQSGIKAKQEQFQGLVIAPMLVEDHLGNPSKVPITKSFSEGVDIGGYFLQAAGARKGTIQKVDAVRDPGVLTKELIQSNIDSPITAHDCGTTHGIHLSSKDRDVVDRYLASPVTVHGKTIPAGTAITPELQSSMVKEGVTSVFVRSPLKCRMPAGVCAICMGNAPSGTAYQVGENIGVIAAQAIGERASQLMLKQTHNQGIVPITRSAVDEFKTVDNIFGFAKKSPVDATIAPRAGTVTRVEAQPQGGWNIHYGNHKEPLYSRQKPYAHVKPGYDFTRGEQLTAGDPNLHALAKNRGLEAMQDWMVNRIGKIYEKEDVLRRHAELTVRNATNTVEVDDPGDHPSILRGDSMQKTVVDEINATALKGKKPIVATPHLASTPVTTAARQSDWLARLMSDKLPQHIITAAALGEKSDIHGLHPIPGLAYGAEFGHGKSVTGY